MHINRKINQYIYKKNWQPQYKLHDIIIIYNKHERLINLVQDIFVHNFVKKGGVYVNRKTNQFLYTALPKTGVYVEYAY